MKIKDLQKYLSVFPDEWEVHIQTTPGDLTQPLESNTFSVVETVDTRGGEQRRERPLLLFTAFFPSAKP